MQFLIFLPIYLLCLTIHEFGHIIMVLKCGHKIIGLSIGVPMKPILTIPIKLIKSGFNLYLTPYFWGAMTFTDIRENEIKTSTLSLITLAGPLLNIMCLIVVYLVRGSSEFSSLVHYFVPSSNNARFLSFWELFIAFNFTCGFGELIPFVSGDGTRLFRIIQKALKPVKTNA